MKRDLSKNGHHDRIDKVEKKASFPGAVKKEKSAKRRLSIYDDFYEEGLDEINTKSFSKFWEKR